MPTRPPSEVRFDFNRRSGKTYAQTGQLVAVSGVISSSPPTDAERDPAPGSYRGADADHLDYALLELSAPAPPPPAQTQGGLAERGYYWTFDGPYRFGADEWLVLAHYPEGAFIRFNYVGGKPKFDYSETRISYRCENTKPGSSGGPIVNAQGRLIALHQGVIVPEQGAAETAPDKRGIPISAIAEDLRRKELGDIVKPENVTRMGRRSYSRHAREQICRELSGDLSAVTRYLKVPGFIDDPDTLWDWLENHNRLPKLRCALEAADRADLVRILDADRVIVDRARMDQIDELAESILRSAAEAEQPGTFTVAMNRVRRLVESLELALLSSRNSTATTARSCSGRLTGTSNWARRQPHLASCGSRCPHETLSRTRLGAIRSESSGLPARYGRPWTPCTTWQKIPSWQRSKLRCQTRSRSTSEVRRRHSPAQSGT